MALMGVVMGLTLFNIAFPRGSAKPQAWLSLPLAKLRIINNKTLIYVYFFNIIFSYEFIRNCAKIFGSRVIEVNLSRVIEVNAWGSCDEA